MRALDVKMARELWRLRVQLLSIALVVATAVTSLVTMRGTYEALERGRREYYRDARMAHVWAELERAPESVRTQLEAIPGVASVETRVQTYASLDLPWLDAPGLGLFLSVPAVRRARVNDVVVRRGSQLAPSNRAGVLVSELFFEENGLALGDTIVAVLDGTRRALTITGTAIAPDHSYIAPPGGLYPDDERFGVFWMIRDELAGATDFDAAFNSVALRTGPTARLDEVIAAVDRLLDPYGGRGAYGRSEQLSYKILNDELNQNRIMGVAFPAVFLLVATFLLHMVLGRLVSTQRTEIGALKAMGYTDAEVGRHFLGYSLAAVVAGTALGAIAGLWAGAAMIDLYGRYFRFPGLRYDLSFELIFLGGGVSLAAAALGGSKAVRAATSLAPAEAMRPEPPARYSAGLAETSGAIDHLSNRARFIVRNIERRPGRTAASAAGIALSVSILVVGMFMLDGVSRMMSVQFQLMQREDLTVSFRQAVGSSGLHDLRAAPHVLQVEGLQHAPVRVHAGHRVRETALTALEPEADLRRIVDEDGRVHHVPHHGVVVSSILAAGLGVSTGDELRVEALDGHRRTRSMTVVDIVDDLFGSAVYATPETLRGLTRAGPQYSMALLTVESGAIPDVSQRLQRTPSVASVSSPSRMFESFQEQLDESLLVGVTFLVAFASVISVAVIYNGTRIALSERGRELASLRVLGFTRGEVAALLFGEQAFVTALGIPVGWALGYGLAALVTTSMASETYRIPLVVSLDTYAWSAVITVAASIGSALLVRGRLNRLDLIAVLKTRE